MVTGPDGVDGVDAAEDVVAESRHALVLAQIRNRLLEALIVKGDHQNGGHATHRNVLVRSLPYLLCCLRTLAILKFLP